MFFPKLWKNSMVFLDVLLKCRRVWLIAGNPGVRGQACLAFGRKTRFLELNNGATVESRNFCNNSATHPVHKRKKKNRKRLPTAKDFSMGNFHSERLRLKPHGPAQPDCKIFLLFDKRVNNS